MVVAFLLGLVCAFLGSVPIAGPAAVLVVERGLGGHGRSAFGVAVGTGIAEAGYALLAFLGMTAALSELPWMLPVSRILGAVILFGLGLFLAFRSPKPEPETHVPDKRLRGRDGFVLGLVVTAVNPTLIASWSAVVTVLHSTGLLRVKPLDAFPFGIGVGAGAILWFAVLLALIRKLRDRLRQETLDRVVRILGWLLVVCGGALTIKLAIDGLWPPR